MWGKGVDLYEKKNANKMLYISRHRQCFYRGPVLQYTTLINLIFKILQT